jgi:cytochrome c
LRTPSPLRNLAAHGFAALAFMAQVACNQPRGFEPDLRGGDRDRGRAVLVRFECGSCHRIPGIPAARGNVGPDLEDFRRRPYIAGSLANTPESLVHWLVDPPALAPETAMPAIGLDAGQARDVAAYLYALE